MGVKMNLNLDKLKPVNHPVIIFHSIHYKGNRFRISTGQNIEPKHWDRDKQRVKRDRANYDEFNAAFKEQQNNIERIILKLERTGRPIEKETIVAQLNWVNAVKGNNASLPATVFETFVKVYGTGKAKNTIKGYKTTLSHLLQYQTLKQTVLSFSDFTAEFYANFRAALNINDNHFGSQIKNLKTFLAWANDNGYHDTWYFKKWKVTNEDGKEQFFLKVDEIKKIEALELIERLDRVRDLFLIGYYTGLRFSDIISLKEVHFKEGTISKTNQKTKIKVSIPVIPELKIILQKYWKHKKELPRITNQKGNEYLKEIGKLANLTRPFNYEQIKGTEVISQTFEAWQCLSFHVARHSFITNCVQLGVNPRVVQKIVGHKTFKMMERYVQNDDAFNKIELMKISNK
jgi:integrase